VPSSLEVRQGSSALSVFGAISPSQLVITSLAIAPSLLASIYICRLPSSSCSFSLSCTMTPVKSNVDSAWPAQDQSTFFDAIIDSHICLLVLSHIDVSFGARIQDDERTIKGQGANAILGGREHSYHERACYR
jgi:hypothetical protein